MGSTAVEKTAEELQREIDELHRQQREITERLRDPRGIRRGGLSAGVSPRNFAANGGRGRSFPRQADRNDAEDLPPAKRRLSSAVVKVEDGEIIDDAEGANDFSDTAVEGSDAVNQTDRNLSSTRQSGWSRRDGNQRALKKDTEAPITEHVPRILPKDEDPSLVNRNKRMLGQLLGTLERFRKEDMQLSGTEAMMRRSNSLQRAEQRAREESERLRLQEREQIAEKRRRDLTLRARVMAKAEEKKLELLFLQWSEHHKKLSNFIRTKTEPAIYYLPKNPLPEDATMLEQQKEKEFLEWKTARREELSEYQKQIGEQYVANVEKDLERWQNARKARKVNNDMNLQETMDKELDTHRLEHGPKKRKIPALLVLAVVLIIVLAVKPKKPQFDLQQVGVQYMGISTPNPSAFDGTATAVTTTPTTASLSLTIHMLFTAANPNKVGIKYGESRFTVMYRGIPLGKATVPGFYQEAHSTRNVEATIAVDRANLMQADAADLIRDASLNDRVELRVLGDVGAKIRVLEFDSPGVQVTPFSS
ncbi:Late embryogenesis abundant protein, LEA-14 [Corchorus olitorius]|uniref:Late embryogenesis abundant protein, LEA-14 n=1 Tax=Corchorus olitorius TaxID=93759 RepID=A0A1R3JB74_9ROSI|nr:Late embryogenesis abundant protein, LEA-14 [Corchorus olitorius]